MIIKLSPLPTLQQFYAIGEGLLILGSYEFFVVISSYCRISLKNLIYRMNLTSIIYIYSYKNPFEKR